MARAKLGHVWGQISLSGVWVVLGPWDQGVSKGQVWASEGWVGASESRVGASEGWVRAAEGRVGASEGRVRASEGRFGA